MAIVKTPDVPTAARSEPSLAAAIARSLLWLAWQALRLPVFALLVIFEPMVRVVFSCASLLAVLTAFLFEFSGVAPTFPFWGMIAFSVGCALLLIGYYGLLRMFSR